LLPGLTGRVGREQDHLTTLVVGAEHEYLGHERPDPLRRKIHDRDDTTTDEVVRTVMSCDLGARALDAELRAEIDLERVGGPARLGKFLRARDHPDADVDLLEVRELDGAGAGGQGSPPASSDPKVVPG
jgi:hypothetical protein